MYHIFAKMGGWDRLVRAYGQAAESSGTKLTKQTVKVGPVRWRWSMDMVFSTQGLYLQPTRGLGSQVFGKLAPVLIPWSQFNSPCPGRIYLGWKCVEFSVGEPEIATITFPLALYRRMSPFLPPSVSSAYPAGQSGN